MSALRARQLVVPALVAALMVGGVPAVASAATSVPGTFEVATGPRTTPLVEVATGPRTTPLVEVASKPRSTPLSASSEVAIPLPFTRSN